MSTVHFVHTGAAYLPELAAYATHLNQLGHSSQVHRCADSVPNNADMVWWICGHVSPSHTRRLHHSVHVHEYASASVPPAAWLKDRVKQLTHPRPQHRIFQNEWVRHRIGLTDAVPYSLRDMGVPAGFLTAQAQQAPEFDLVYLGAMSRLTAFWPTLQAIHQAGLRLLLIGDIPPALQARLQGLPNIHCTGRLPQDEVPIQLLRARVGLNLMPEELPLTEQTSTKMLEYLATGLPVISNPYTWAHIMAQQHAGCVQLLNPLCTPQQWQMAVAHAPAPLADRSHLRALSWSTQLDNLPVWQLL
jgi:glycosyltransferase involved in cell wall biosynthesis